MSGSTVVCLGNPWHGDDGFGQHVFRRLREQRTLPASVALVDGGVAGLGALACLEGRAKAVLVDAVDVGAPVGTVHRLAAAELEPPGNELSLHEYGLSGLLAAHAAIAPVAPDVVIIGAQVGAFHAFSDALSAPLRAAVPTAAAMVARECARA